MKDNLWFTYKARIQAQKRLASNCFHSELLLVWYALLSVVFSVVSACQVALLGPYTGLVSSVFAIALLVISMLVANRDFRGRAIFMRNNYLALHALHSQLSTPVSASEIARYHELLASSENHTSMDDRVFRVSMGAALDTRKPSLLDYAQVYGYKAMRFSMFAVFYLAPLAAILFLA